MGLVIDSSVLVAAERGLLDLGGLLDRHGDEEIVISAVTASELLHGVHRLAGAARARADAFVERLLETLPVIAFDLDVARTHAALSADLRGRSVTIGAHDLQIAATAVCLDYAVATRDLRSFGRIDGIEIVKW